MNRIALAVVAAGVLGLTACDPQAGPPTVIETPTIVWEPAEPTGGLYDDPYVKVALAASLGFVLANNSGDFTIAQLTETTTANWIHEIWKGYLGQHGYKNQDPIAFVGPLPRVPVSVTEHADGDGADVVVCTVAGGWYVSEDQAEAEADIARTISYIMVIVDDGGVLKLDKIRGGETGCDVSGVVFGRFDPEPTPYTGQLRPPLRDED